MALVQLVLTAIPCVASVAVAGVTRDSVDAGSVVAWVGLAVVDIALTKSTFITFSTAALVAVGSVVAFGSVLAGRAGALIYVDLTHGASKPWLAGAGEAVDHVSADAVVHTWIALTVIHVNLTIGSRVTWHADAGELSDAVQARCVILAGHGQALVDVDLAARAGVSSATLALERPLRVHTLPEVLTGIRTDRTLVHVLVAGASDKASRTCANGAAIEWVGVAHRPLVAGVADTGVVEVAQKARLSYGALAEERCHAVVAGSAVETNGDGAVIDVLAAVVARPAVDTHAGVAADGVETGTAVVAGVWLHETLVDVLGAVLACPLWWTLTVVCINSINTNATVHTLMARAVIDIILTVVAFKPWQAGTLVGMVAGLSAGATVETLRRCAGQGGHLTGASTVPRLALAPEGPGAVQAQATVETHAGLSALVYIISAVLSLVARRAGTVVMVVPVGAPGPIGTGACRTGIYEGAVLASEPSVAHTGVLWDAGDHLAFTGCSIQTW